MNLNELASELARRSANANINLDVAHVKKILNQLGKILAEQKPGEALNIIAKLVNKP